MKLLVDSDFLIALYRPTDSNHQHATTIFKTIEKSASFTALTLVFQESTTVISKQLGMDHARKFYDAIRLMVHEPLTVDDDLERRAWKLFLKQTKKGTSFIDCANLAAHEKFKFNGILSFDRFYPRSVLWHQATRSQSQ